MTAAMTVASTSEGSTECHQLSKKAMGKIPSFNPSQYCASGASTRSGTETPSTARNAAPLSQMVPCLRAPRMPSGKPTSSPITMAWIPKKAETGSRSMMTSVTGLPPYWNELPRSPRAMSTMYRAYCAGRGLSRSYWASICASCWSVSFSACFIGEPGRSCMRNQVTEAMMNSTTRALTSRLKMYLSIPPPQQVRGKGRSGFSSESRISLSRNSLLWPLCPTSLRLSSRYLRVLPVVAAEGVRRVALEVGLLQSGPHLEVHGDGTSLVDQDLLRLEHVLHALVQVGCGLGFLDEPVVLLVLEKGVVERRVREEEVHKGHRVVVVADPAEGVADLVVLSVHPLQRGVEGHCRHLKVGTQVLFVLVLHKGRQIPVEVGVTEEHLQLGCLTTQLLYPLLPELPRRLYVLGHEVAVGLPEGLVTGAGVDRRRDEAVGGQRAVREYLLGEGLPIEADHDRLANVEVV